MNYLCEVEGNFQCASSDLLFAPSLKYNIYLFTS